MKFAKIKNEGEIRYVSEWDDETIAMLANFLYSAIRTDWSYDAFTNWLKHKEIGDRGVYGEIYGLEEHNGRIYVIDTFDSEEERYKYFNTTRENMLRIIDDWVRIICQRPEPSTIIVTEKNEEVKFAAED